MKNSPLKMMSIAALGVALTPQALAENSWVDSRVALLRAHDDGSADPAGLIAASCHVGATSPCRSLIDKAGMRSDCFGRRVVVLAQTDSFKPCGVTQIIY